MLKCVIGSKKLINTLPKNLTYKYAQLKNWIISNLTIILYLGREVLETIL